MLFLAQIARNEAQGPVASALMAGIVALKGWLMKTIGPSLVTARAFQSARARIWRQARTTSICYNPQPSRGAI